MDKQSAHFLSFVEVFIFVVVQLGNQKAVIVLQAYCLSESSTYFSGVILTMEVIR